MYRGVEVTLFFRFQVTITVKPSKPNLQKFHLIYNLEFGDSDEFVQGVYMDVFDKHIVDFSFTGDHAVFKVNSRSQCVMCYLFTLYYQMSKEPIKHNALNYAMNAY